MEKIEQVQKQPENPENQVILALENRQLKRKTKKLKQIVLKIQKQIIIQLWRRYDSKIFRDQRFEMILSKPNKQFHFEEMKGIFKGQFQCQNWRCTQQIQKGQTKKSTQTKNPKSEAETKEKKPEPEQPREFRTWMDWWKSEQSQLQSSQSQADKPTNTQKDVEKVDAKFKAKKGFRPGQIPPGREETKWSSSLSYVTFHYLAYPVPLHKFKQVYKKEKNAQLEIYWSVTVQGQLCKKCKHEIYCQPEFKNDQMDRIGFNFSTFIHNMVNKANVKYRPCQSERLEGHEKSLCEACKEGYCGRDDFRRVKRQ